MVEAYNNHLNLKSTTNNKENLTYFFGVKMAGLSVVGRDHYGVFPLRGKLLNVREASSKQIMENEEIQNIKKILGLQQNKEYTNVKSLRYGHLMIMADQVRVTYRSVY
jgi:DNA gyrase/topoisomerase IV subunit B